MSFSIGVIQCVGRSFAWWCAADTGPHTDKKFRKNIGKTHIWNCFWNYASSCVCAYAAVCLALCVGDWAATPSSIFLRVRFVLYAISQLHKHCLSCLNLWRKHTTPTDLPRYNAVPLRPANGVWCGSMVVGIHTQQRTESIKVGNAVRVKSVEFSSSSSMFTFSTSRTRINTTYRIEHLQLIKQQQGNKMNNFP